MNEAEENHLYSLISNKRFGDDIHLNVTLGELRSLAEVVKFTTIAEREEHES